MTSFQVQSLVQASAPARLKTMGKPAPLPTGNIGAGGATPSFFAENGVIWATGANNNLYPAGFNSIAAYQNWGTKISAAWPRPFIPMTIGGYYNTPFSYQDYPVLRGSGGLDNYWLYACTPTLAPMLMDALHSLGAVPTSKAGLACKGLGSTCSVLTSSGTQIMPVAYLTIVPDITMPSLDIWASGCLFN